MRLLWDYIVQAISDFVFERLFAIGRESQYEIYAHLIEKHNQYVVGMLQPLDISASSPRKPLSLFIPAHEKKRECEAIKSVFPFPNGLDSR
jgi:hypothetical protein